MSYDNQGYSSGNRGSADKQGSSDNPYADPKHDSSQHSYADQADDGGEATTHRTSVFGDAQQGYGGPDDTNLSIPITGSYPASHSSASYPASHGSAGYSAQAGDQSSQSATGYENQIWGAQHQAPDQAWGTQQHAADQAWGAQPQAPEQTWGTQQHATDQAWGGYQQAPDQAWGAQQPPAAAQQTWSAPQTQPPGEDNVVSALTDFSFTKMATPGLVKILYIAAGVLGLLQLLGFTFSAFTLGSQLGTVGVVLGVLGLIGGLVGLLVFVLAVRIYLELALSVVRTSQDVRHLRRKFDEPD